MQTTRSNGLGLQPALGDRGVRTRRRSRVGALIPAGKGGIVLRQGIEDLLSARTRMLGHARKAIVLALGVVFRRSDIESRRSSR
jgi:hypothetical protein